MEKWKIGVIAALFATLVGFGMLQQKRDATPPAPVSDANANTPPAPSPFVGRTIGTDLPNWKVTQWVNTPRPIPLPTLRGQVALVEAFRIDCSHCEEAAPFLQALYRRYQPRGLKMVAIQAPVGDLNNPGRNWKTVQSWIKERGLTYPIGMDNTKWFLDDMKGQSYPTTLVINKSGKVVHAHTGFATDKPEHMMKIIDTVVELERLLPGQGTPAQRAQEVAKWMSPLVGIPTDANTQKSFVDDLTQRLS